MGPRAVASRLPGSLLPLCLQPARACAPQLTCARLRLGPRRSPPWHSYEDPASKPLPSIRAELEKGALLKEALLQKMRQD